jgi:hypothetical protein
VRDRQEQIAPDVEAAIGDAPILRCDPGPGEDSSTGNVTGGRKLARYVLDGCGYKSARPDLTTVCSFCRFSGPLPFPARDRLPQQKVFEDELPLASWKGSCRRLGRLSRDPLSPAQLQL